MSERKIQECGTMTKGNKPKFYGQISIIGDKTRTPIGTIALWKNNPKPASKQPPYTGNIQLFHEKKKLHLAVWENLNLE
jgi:hypothetical protein